MSGYGAIRQRTHEAAQPVVDLTRCYANGCPCKGAISMDGGHRWTCTAHAFAKADKWPQITESLLENAWLIGFIDDVQRIEQARESKLPDWRAYATQFWTNLDPHCVPDKREEAVPYLNRMRGELLFRCGLGKRPAPRLPKPIKGRGNAASFLGKEIA